MSSYRDSSHDQGRRMEEAAGWKLRLLEDPSLAQSPDYAAWAQEPENAASLQAIDEAWRTVGDLAASPPLLEMRRGAIERLQRATSTRRFPARLLVRAAVVLLIAGGIAGGALYMTLRQLDTYQTGIGERRVVPLPDGSRISMDAATEIHVRYSNAAREITLDHGRARFDVEHDVNRPFTVAADGETVVAVGTSFDVERLETSVLVTLLQGNVVIKNPVQTPQAETGSLPRPALSLSSGQQLVATHDTRPVIAPTDLQTASAWEAGHLVFKDEPLEQALARVNRYTARPIRADASAAAIRISGVFNAGDIGAFVSAVTGYFPVQATTTADNGILLQHRS